MEEEAKKLTAEAQDKMIYDSLFLVYPIIMRGQSLNGLQDMEDGLGGYLSDVEMEVLSNNNWKALQLGENHLYVMYDFDGLNEIAETKKALIENGLVDILGDGYVIDLAIDDIVPNGFMIITKRGIDKVRQLLE